MEEVTTRSPAAERFGVRKSASIRRHCSKNIIGEYYSHIILPSPLRAPQQKPTCTSTSSRVDTVFGLCTEQLIFVHEGIVVRNECTQWILPAWNPPVPREPTLNWTLVEDVVHKEFISTSKACVSLPLDWTILAGVKHAFHGHYAPVYRLLSILSISIVHAHIHAQEATGTCWRLPLVFLNHHACHACDSRSKQVS